MSINKSTVIVADDLTGAGDTALQYFKAGFKTKIIIDNSEDFSNSDDIDVWAVSTESRNVSKEVALERVVAVTDKLRKSLNIDNFYKKIDSTLRGNVGVEVVSMFEVLQKDAVIIVPAYIEEDRTTIGAYQLLKGIPIERTQCALDPKAPIFDSYIPDIIKKDLNEKFYDLIDVIDFKTVTKGAGPITLKLNELIQKGKKIIISDAVSNTDLEQIALAINKSNYDILPCASAGLAQAFNKLEDGNEEDREELPPINLPRLIISGSATQLSSNQIQKLKENSKNIFSLDLTLEDIIRGQDENIINKISENLSNGYDVIIHTSNIKNEIHNENASDLLIDEGIAKDELPSKITEYLSDVVYEINYKNNFILIIIGGETSYKCTKKIGSKYLQIIDTILPAVPLCKDINDKIIVTKSGNFGTPNTLVDIINYFDKLK